MTALRVRPEADRDTDQAADYYAREANLDLGLRFLGAVEAAYARLLEHPHIGSTVASFHPRLSGLRFWPVPGFESHLVFYVPSVDSVEIVRVLHGAQDLQQVLTAVKH